MRRLAALAFLLLAAAPAAQAATNGPVFGLRAAGNPKLGYFVYTLAPGASRSGAIIVSNSGTAPGTVKLFTADATTGHTTGTVYLTDKKPSRTGSWVKLAQTRVTLAPGAHRRVPFTVHVPKGTKAGQWVGGIVAETSNRVAGTKTTKKASVQIKIRDLTIVAVQANVPGPPVVSFQIGDAKTGGQRGFQQLIVHFANTGNVLRKPKGHVTVTKSNGAVVETLPFKMDTFLPQTAIDYPILLKKALAPGEYKAAVTLDVPGATRGTQRFQAQPAVHVSNADVKQVFTSAQPTQPPPVGATGGGGSSTPWLWIAVGAVALVVLVLLLLLLRSRRRPPAAAEEPEPPAAVIAPAPPAPAPVPDPAPAPAPEPAPVPAPAAETAEAEPAPAPAPDCDHLWDVAYDKGQLGADGVWRFPHRCRTCGLEILAADVADAAARARQR